MFVDLAISFDPGVELTFADREPGNEIRNRDSGFVTPCPDKIYYGVSRIMGDPDAC